MGGRKWGLFGVTVLMGVSLLRVPSIAYAGSQSATGALPPDLPGLHNDAFVAPDGPGILGMMYPAGAPATPGYYQTSEYMLGSVAVGIVLVESDGSADPSTEDWSPEEKALVFSEIKAALEWWAALEPRAHLTFVYDDHFTEPLPTRVEPISRPHTDQRYWIADAKAALGYQAASYFTSVRTYNNDLRRLYHTDWAFTIFVVDSSADPDDRFSDGYFAYAYLGGPFMVLTYGNGNYGPQNMKAVAAHEIGHIFYALDQYREARIPCTRRSGYLDAENQNSEHGSCVSNRGSIMRLPMYYVSNALDPYAAAQVGWRDSDGDNILDPLDTELALSITASWVNGETVVVSGTVSIIPYPSPSRQSITINKLVAVQYRFDAGEWQPAVADDGAFDSAAEAFHFTARLPPGVHNLEVRAVDSAGNTSSPHHSERLIIPGPDGEPLNTELDDPETPSVSGSVDMGGVAYHLENQAITQVQYRVDGGAWERAEAADGAFDSDYEPFVLPLALEPGVHLIEARAVDAAGNTETTWASGQVIVAGRHILYLPLVVHR
ncbi:MAG: hypothetical protein N2508_15915 [Anaerolineae bacterium]|nr:hypothetical protein [Anaerolineae bacterium]